MCEADRRTAPEVVAQRVVRRQEALQTRRLAAGITLVTGEKACAGPCGRLLPLASFWKRADSLDGYGAWCRACGAERRRRPDPEDQQRWDRWQRRDQEYEDLVESLRLDAGDAEGGALHAAGSGGVADDGDGQDAEQVI